MDKETAMNSSMQAMDSDPREAKFGYYAGGSFVLDSLRTFSWFSDLNEMVKHLIEVEPAVYDWSDEDAAPVRAQLAELLDGLKAGQLTNELRSRVNGITKGFLKLDWWGTFEELTDGETEFAANLRSDFRDFEENGAEGALTAAELDGFVAFLKEYGI